MRNLEMQRNLTFSPWTLERIQHLALTAGWLRGGGTAVLWNRDLAIGNIPAGRTLPHRQQGNHKTGEEQSLMTAINAICKKKKKKEIFAVCKREGR